ncbi:hypothetical protein Vretimale_14798 [Volvox reticuliferus]|nr:hypothetical protein Vretimale_14798 [Volvox reticuliferus]
MQHALSIFQEIFWTAAAANATRGAYLVEFTSEGLLLATFASTADALATCMAVQSELLVADWPRVLLEHDMCEEVTIATPQPGGTIVREVLFRGLRVKAGVDCGPARAALNGATGRIAYRGRVMNRAARINARGSSGQVLCSRSAWQAASEAEEGGPAARGLAALSLGHMALKGIGEPVEILEIRPHVLAPPPSSQQSTLMGRIMLASHPSRGSLTPLASDATAISTVVVAGASLRPTSSITAQTLPCPSNGGGGAPARVSTCPSPVKVAPVSSVALCDGPDISRLNRRDGMMAAAAAAASIATAAATASDNSRTGGDLARLPSDAGAVLLQHSGSSFPGGSRLLPQASSVAQLQTAQIQRAVPESKWFPRSISRLDSGIEQPLPNLPATEDMLATATFPPPPTVQVFRIDTTTGIAALELPSPFPAPAPSPAPAPAMMETGTASAAVSAGGSTEVPAPLSMMIGIDG